MQWILLAQDWIQWHFLVNTIEQVIRHEDGGSIDLLGDEVVDNINMDVKSNK
jgi:hypothetical protein